MSAAPHRRITFNYNWNGKLFCNCFTTIRLRNDEKYRVGYEYDVILKGQNSGPAICCGIKHFKLAELNDFTAMIDTGYNKQDCTAMLKTMYKNIVTNWETQFLSIILLRRTIVDRSQAEPPKTIIYKAKPKAA